MNVDTLFFITIYFKSIFTFSFKHWTHNHIFLFSLANINTFLETAKE